MKKLPLLLCPQEYDGMTMVMSTCSRCASWNKAGRRCDVYIGIEDEPLVEAREVPVCPVQDRCQHQAQESPNPCAVRARGQLCESAVGEHHPLAFSAMLK